MAQFNLKAYLSTRKEWVEKALFELLPTPEDTPDILVGAMRHALLAGGKRLRPILCLAAAEGVGKPCEPVMPAACAVELLHNYTLVHDDLPCMDNDVERRGSPSVWKQFGEGIGVLAGDALLTLAFGVLVRTPEIRPGIQARLVHELSLAAGACGVIGGQVEDIAYDGHPTRDQIDYVFQHKTADLFRAACRLGAVASDASDANLTRISSFANHLGFAFQIQDDLLDAGNARKDERPELSCLDLMSAEEATAWASRETEAAVAALADLPGYVEPLRALAESLQNRKF